MQNDPFDTNPNYEDSSLREVREYLSAFRKIAGRYASFSTEDFVKEAMSYGAKKSNAIRHLNDFRLHVSTMRKIFKEYQRNALICCFSEEATNILMWSYYSNSHSSYCLRFRLREGENGGLAVANVRYLNERSRLETVDMMKRMAASSFPDLFPSGGEDTERVDNATLLAKSSHWEHEVEWRSLQTPNFGEGYHSIEPYYFDGVILGAKCSDATEVAMDIALGRFRK